MPRKQDRVIIFHDENNTIYIKQRAEPEGLHIFNPEREC